MKMKIVNIHENRRFPNVIYAELVNAENGECYIASTLDYIFQKIRERKMECVNIEVDKWGNFSIIDV